MRYNSACLFCWLTGNHNDGQVFSLVGQFTRPVPPFNFTGSKLSMEVPGYELLRGIICSFVAFFCPLSSISLSIA